MRTPQVQIVDYTSGTKLDVNVPDAFRSKVSSFLDNNKANPDKLLAGDIQMFGLAELKEWIGDAWLSVKLSVHKLIDHILSEELEENDVYFAADDERYVILFARLTPEEADRKAKEIAQKVAAALGREDGPAGGSLTARCKIVSIDRKDPALASGPEALAGAVTKTVANEEQEKRANFEQRKDTFKPLYWPVTNVEKKLISFYRTEIVSETANAAATERPLPLDLDKFGLERLASDIAKRRGVKHKAIGMLSISYDTLDERSSRLEFLDFAESLDAKTLGRMALELVDLPTAISQTRLNQIFTEASPFFAGFVCRFQVSFEAVNQLDGLKLLGASIDGRFLGTERPRKRQFRDLKRFVERIAGRRIRTFFVGAQSVEAAIAAKRAEFDYIDGKGVLQPMPMPGRVYRMS